MSVHISISLSEDELKLLEYSLNSVTIRGAQSTLLLSIINKINESITNNERGDENE